MPEKLSTFVFSGFREAQQKFDYFVTGISGALFAYIAQTYTPERIAFSPAILEPASLVCLAVSFFLGVRRIATYVTTVKLNHDMLDHGEKAGSCTDAMLNGGHTMFDRQSGEVASRHDFEVQRQFHMKQAESARIDMELASSRFERIGYHRDWWLYCGFGAIFLSKILAPYG